MTLRELEIFYRLCDAPHLSNLASEMGISQSAISLALKSLETKLGEPLFDRLGKKLLLNERGHFFREQTHRHYLALRESQSVFAQESMAGTLRIASSKTIGNYLTPHLISSFISIYPMVHIDASTLNSTEIIENIAEGGADIGFIESENTHEKIIRIPMSNDELIVVSKDASLASEHRYIDQLFDRKWLLREEGSGTRSVFLAGLGDISGKLPVFMEYHDFEELKTLLHSNGDMITCISRHAVAGELAQGTLHQVPLINLTFTRQFYLIHHRDKYLGKIVQNFMDLAVNFQPL